MKTNHFNFLCVLIVLVSCGTNKPKEVEVPSNIVSQDTFIRVLTDCYLAEGASGINIKNVPGEKLDSTYLFNPLKNYSISKIKFDSSVSFYSRHPILFKQINDAVLEKLSKISANGSLDVSK